MSSSLSIPSQPGGDGITPAVAEQMKGTLRAWLASAQTWPRQESSIPDIFTLMAPLFFPEQIILAYLCMFNLLVFMSISDVSLLLVQASSMLLIPPLLTSGTLFYKSSPLLLRSSSLLLLFFFNAVFCFFFYYKSNTISLEMYGNLTHYHKVYMHKIMLSTFLSAFPGPSVDMGTLGWGRPEVEIIEGCPGRG